jgi:hypothetical protein
MVVGAARAGLVVLALLVPRPAATAAAVPGPARQPAPPGAASVTATGDQARPTPWAQQEPGEPDQPGEPGSEGAGLSLLVATEGRPSTEAAFPFVVGEGATISGRLRFLSYEYPDYYGSEYNDLFSVALATPHGAVILATGNLNNSTWGEGSQGYTGGAETLAFNEDLGRFAGQTVELQVHVANVADTFYDSAVAVLDLRIDDEPACSDDRLADLHGMSGGAKDERVDGLDDRFTGRDGARFQSMVETVAAEAGVGPGLLAANALGEEPATGEWLAAGEVDVTRSGVDDWAGIAGDIRKAIPGAPEIPTTAAGDFRNGRDALRAMAWLLRYADVRMANEAGPAYTDLPANVRYALQRFAVDQGIPAAVDLARAGGAAGDGVLAGDGDVGPSDPQRTATVRAAQAVHLANTVFGEGASCR